MKYKMGIIVIVVLFLCAGNILPCFSSGDNWLTDFQKASKLSKEKNLPILMDFAGSDWCGWCMKLDREVFSKEPFKKYAEKNLILFMADFPKTKPQSKEVKKQNEDLARKFGIRGFPTVILLNPEGKIIAQTGYKAGGAEAYVEHIKSLLTEKKEEKSSGLWLEDFNKAVKLSKEKNLPLLIDFSGSDWCYWCKKLDREVFSQEAFKKYAKENLILYSADFPSEIVQSPQLKAKNNELKDRYGITGFPTIIILNPKGKIMARTGYKEGGAAAYVKHLQSLLKK